MLRIVERRDLQPGELQMTSRVDVAEYRINDGGPLKEEYYGPCWTIRLRDGIERADPVVIVPDPGDGTSRDLANRILGLLNDAGREGGS